MRPSARTLYVWTGAECTYGCGDCPIEPARQPPAVSAADLHRRLDERPDAAGQLVVLVGGEPLLRPDLLRLLAVIRAAGAVPGIATTGRPLVYPQLRQRLRRAGVGYLRVQVFGTGETHDRHTAVPGSWQQALSGVGAWLAESAGSDGGSCDVDVALYARGRSAEGLVSEVEELASRIDSARAQILVADAGDLEAGTLARLVASLATWSAAAERPLLSWEGVPEALAPPGCLTVPARRPVFVHESPSACCLGNVGVSIDAGDSTPAAVANSFNFVRAGTSVPYVAAPESCTAHRAAGSGDDARRLWLIEGDELKLYETDTGDFSAGEIALVKDRWSHLFLDRAAAGVLDDFREGMRRVLPDDACASCANRAHCARRFAVVEGQPFAREEAWIADYVRALRGRVLDVGCGEQLYRDEIVPLVRSGLVAYTGLDPDQPTLAAWRELLPEGRFFATGIEDFAGEPGGYRRVLCLRSLNHVLDLDEAIARMANLVEPGGQVLIVETTPFAMLRTADQVAAADRAPRAGHQHFRNLTSEEVLPLARRHSLRVLHHHPVGLRTSNEWILLLERPAVR